MNSKQELQAMTDHLQDYVLDGELYKTVTVKGEHGDSLIKMTIGGMLDRIAALEANSESLEVVGAAREAVAREQRSQPEGFTALVAREAKSNADSWSWYLQRVTEGEEQSIRDFPQEKGIRTRLERLLELGGNEPALQDTKSRTATLDRQLKEHWQGNTTEGYWWENGSPQLRDND
jgi:hypothetical protein